MSELKNIRAYDKKADDYDNTADGKFTDGFKNFLLENLRVEAGDSVLDVGCGNGALLARIAAARRVRGFGTDISPGMIKNAIARCPDFKFATSGCEKIPFADMSMDIITVCAAFHHFPNVRAFAAEARRLLKKTGSVYIAEIYLPPVLRHVANIFLPLSSDGDVKFYSRQEIVAVFEGEGFRAEKFSRRRHMQIIQLKADCFNFIGMA